MQVWLPERTQFDQTKFFLWMRIVAVSLSAIAGVAQVLNKTHDAAAWIESFSLACLFAFWRTRRPCESRRAYLTNPRALVTFVSAVAIVISSVWWLIRHTR